MIGRLSGMLLEKTPPRVLVDVNGVGYEVDVPMSTFCNLPAENNKITLLTHMVVREDAQLLYGFSTEAERTAFRALLKISGIGPRIALAVLSGMNATDLVSAIESGESSLLTRIPGIGKKTAERLVLELKGKLTHIAGTLPAATSTHANASDILGALVALGYSERAAQAAGKPIDPTASVSDGIRLALRHLSR